MNFALRSLAFAAVLAAPLAAFATDIKVPGDYATIQEAVDAVDGTGFRILVSKGTYAESVVVTDKNDLSIVGKGHPVIQAQEGLPALSVQGGDGILLTGFDVEGGLAGLEVTGAQNIRVVKVTARNTLGAGIRIANVRGLEVSSCVTDNTDGAGIQCESVRNLVVSKCKVNDTGAEGINVLSASTGVEGGLAGVVSGNTVTFAGLTGIAYSGGTGAIVKNKVADSGDQGISVLVSGDVAMSVSKNKVDRSGTAGIGVEGTMLTVEKNKVGASGGNGFTIQGTGAQVVKNQASTGTVGFALAGGGGHAATSNKVKTPSGNGINVTSPGNTLLKNNVIAAGADGYFVSTSGNSFTSNKAKASGGSGLNSLQAPEENEFVKNNFGTETYPE